MISNKEQIIHLIYKLLRNYFLKLYFQEYIVIFAYEIIFDNLDVEKNWLGTFRSLVFEQHFSADKLLLLRGIKKKF